MKSYRLGLITSTMILAIWTLALRPCAALGDELGAMFALPLGLACAAAIALVLVASRPERSPGPAGLALRVVGFAAGYSVGHAMVPWLTALAGADLAASSTLSPLALLPLELAAPLVFGLWAAHLTGATARLDDPGADLPRSAAGSQ